MVNPSARAHQCPALRRRASSFNGSTSWMPIGSPFGPLVTGRYKHFISAFGEHVISEEVEQSISELCYEKNIEVNEFTVAPLISPEKGLPYHEWWIEFNSSNIDFDLISDLLDKKMQEKNIYYKDLIQGKVLKRLEIIKVEKGGFNLYMKSIGKFGGQNKVQKLSNDRNFVEGLKKFSKK